MARLVDSFSRHSHTTQTDDDPLFQQDLEAIDTVGHLKFYAEHKQAMKQVRG